MIKIFARQGTDQKALIVCSQDKVHETQIILNSRYPGNWVYVESLYPSIGEVLLFNDGLVYRGFDPAIDRFCNGIDNFNKPIKNEVKRKGSTVVGYFKNFTIFNDRWIHGQEVLDDNNGNIYYVGSENIFAHDQKGTIATVFPKPPIGTVLYVNNDYEISENPI